MKHIKIILLVSILFSNYQTTAQESKDDNYIEFNDRKTILHGIYLGTSLAYGDIKGNETAIAGLQLAYVANKKMEIGIAVKGLYSALNSVDRSFNDDFDLLGVYGGLHSENILFSTSKISLSFPFLIGVGYIQASGPLFKNSDIVLVLEPGINVLFNVSRYIHFEAGLKYRISSPADPVPNILDNINGISIGLGAKIGVFNLNRNRYKKEVPKS